MTLARAPNVVLSTRAASSSTPSARFRRANAPPRARGFALTPRASAGDGAQDPIIGGKAAQDAARKALQGAMGGKRDVLSQFDGGGGGGDGDDGSPQARKIAGWIVAVAAFLTLFKPVTAVIVNAVYYAFGWRTGREPLTDAERAALAAPADASIISKYAADDDDDEDDDDDDHDDDE